MCSYYWTFFFSIHNKTKEHFVASVEPVNPKVGQVSSQTLSVNVIPMCRTTHDCSQSKAKDGVDISSMMI